jgi:hypothetical protein
MRPSHSLKVIRLRVLLLAVAISAVILMGFWQVLKSWDREARLRDEVIARKMPQVLRAREEKDTALKRELAKRRAEFDKLLAEKTRELQKKIQDLRQREEEFRRGQMPIFRPGPTRASRRVPS